MHSEVTLLGPSDNILNYFNHKEDNLAGMLMINVLMHWDILNHLKTTNLSLIQKTGRRY